MEKEDADLLVKDLYARIPYGVVVRIDRADGEPLDAKVRSIIKLRFPNTVMILAEDPNNPEYISVAEGDIVKPYLRPESSMTEAERDEVKDYLNNSIEGKLIGVKGRTIWLVDWLNEHHIDYRGLVGKGLAIEAPDGMYGFGK